uniref:MHC class II regulatory factor RFX1 isoform X4 n=1 Tax=Geotrypetes seraphini TaxID=260995 RepID=A0A6P8PF99_GEOSA|nr:MHC class II regulatory factor RFX1 isoform X4 [Geotrypetes seraphini]
MATQTYVTELQAAPAQPQAAAQQYGADLQSASQQPAAQSSQKQYVAEIQSPQPQSLPAAVAPQQYIVVTVSDGPLRPGDSVSESSPGSTSAQVGVPTQVVQQVQAAQQRLVVQSASQAGKGTQLALTVHALPQQVQSPPETNSTTPKAGQVQQLQVHGVQQVSVSQERSVVQSTAQAPKTSPVQQLTVQGLQQVHVTQESPGSQLSVPARKCQPQPQPQPQEEQEQQRESETDHPPKLEDRMEAERFESTGAGLQYVQSLPSGVGSEHWVELVRVLPQQLLPPPQQQPFIPAHPQSPEERVKVQRVPQVLVFGTAATALKVQQLQQVPVQHVYPSQVQYVEGGDASYTASTIRSNTYPYTETPLYTQNAGTTYYESQATPAQVQWLLDNYETAEGVSLPRSTLYCHYLMHCQEQKLEPVNAASFGKLIRSVFMGLRTRRLGTRGNSKYHYYGLRIKGNSSLLRLMEDQQHLAMRQQPFSQKQRLKPIQKMESMTNGVGAGQQQAVGLSDISAQVQQYQQFLDASRSLPEFVEIDLQGKALPDGLCAEEVKVFQMLYREHCEAIVDVMINLQFTLVETLWKTFWRYNLNQPSESASSAVIHDEAEKRLPKDSLVILSKYEPVLKWTKDCDNSLYQGLVEILIPDVLRPIPSALTQAVRNFAKSLESWLSSAMMNIPEEMVRVKVAAASAFAQTLRRYTSLNHLAQAARAVLQNTAQISQMLSDLNRVDFANVQEQASWVCRCEDRVVQRLEQDFKMTLQQQNSLEQWAAWLDGVVNQILKPYQGNPSFPKAAKLFLLKWSFYSSMVIRDLTLRSAASFGSFHLIRLLYDEYMYYLIEHRVAQAKGETPIAVMGEFANLASSLNPLDPDKDEEEEEEEESDEEMPQELSLHAESTTLTADPLEPPTKLARTGAIFVHAPPST